MPPTIAVPLVGFSSPHSMRIVVDLPAPLLPRKPKTSPCRDVERQWSTATKSPKRRVRSATMMAFIGLSRADRAGQPRFGEPRVRDRPACDRARPAAARPARRARRCWSRRRRRIVRRRRGALRSPRATPSSAAAIAARLASSSRRRCRISTASTASNSASRARPPGVGRGGLGDLGARRPPSNSGQLTFTLASHESCHASCRGKMRGFGLRVVHAASDRDRRLACPRAAACVRDRRRPDALARARARSGRSLRAARSARRRSADVGRRGGARRRG